MPRPNVREQIVDAGFAAFYGKGFNGSSVQDITAAAGVPKGSFYNHFESKETLGADIVDRYDASNTLLAILADATVPALERLRAYYDGLAANLESGDCARGCLLGNFSAEVADHSPLIRGRLKGVFARWTGALESAIRDGQLDGSIPGDVDAATLATVLLDAFEGAMLRARVERRSEPFARFMTVAFEKILC